MKKEELIEELKKEIEATKNVLNCEEHFSLYAKGKRVGLEFGWMFAEKLDEPELPVIPQFVADWIEESKGVDDDFWEAATEMIRDSITSLTKKGRKVHDWLFGNSVIVTVMLERQKLITRAWLDGYTIEKEKLYYVALPYIGYMTNDKDQPFVDYKEDSAKSTEQEIKAIDERFWAFREEVEV